MPIRTNRGRAAVYRRLWGWPLRSPRHLAAALVGLAAVAAVLGVVVPKVAPSRTAQARVSTAQMPMQGVPVGGQPGQQIRGTGGPTTSLPTRLSSPQAAPVSAAPAPEALSVAESWGRAWVDHPDGITSAHWLEQLKPFTTDEYLPVLASTDPGMVPATEVTGKPVPGASYASSIEVTLPTDAGPIKLTVINTPRGWRVAGHTKAG